MVRKLVKSSHPMPNQVLLYKQIPGRRLPKVQSLTGSLCRSSYKQDSTTNQTDQGTTRLRPFFLLTCSKAIRTAWSLLFKTSVFILHLWVTLCFVPNHNLMIITCSLGPYYHVIILKSLQGNSHG